MNEENINNINEEEKKIIDEIITPAETGQIIEPPVEVKKKEEEVRNDAVESEVHEEEASEEVVEGVSEDVKDVEEDEKGTDDSSEQVDELSDAETTESTSDVEEDTDIVEEKEEPPVEEEESEKEEKEEEQKSENDIDLEAIQKELAELKAEKEEAQQVKELIEVANKVEAEYDRVVKGINEALKETMAQYQIPTDVTLQELAEQDPAKAEIARSLIAQAKHALDFNTQQLSQMYKSKEQDVIFTKAERAFNKYELTDEQANVAAETFISILQASGLQDLDADLEAKVELSVAQARFKVPVVREEKKEEVVAEAETKEGKEEAPINKDEEKEGEEKVPEVKAEATEEAEKVNEKEAEDVPSKEEEKPQEEPSNDVSIKKGVAKVAPKVDLSGYKEGIEGSGQAAVSGVDTSNVLHKLASLPFKERQAFLKQNFNLVNKAMREASIKKNEKQR